MNLLFQQNLFWESEFSNEKEVLGKHFSGQIENVPEDYLLNWDYKDYKKKFEGFNFIRGSLALAKKMGRNLDKFYLSSFAPVFRNKMVSSDILFAELSYFQYEKKLFPLFLRPDSCFKEFAGNVFDFGAYERELALFKHRFGHENILCGFANPKKILKEWRCVFVNNQYISGSQYLENGELSVTPKVPQDVIAFANNIASNDYFINLFDFVVDIGLFLDRGLERFGLIEINSFECSSFYAADLDKIYSAWKKANETN